MSLPQTLQIVQTQRPQIEILQDQLSNLTNLDSTIEAQQTQIQTFQGQNMEWQRKYQVDAEKAYASKGPVAMKWIAPKEGDR